MNAVAIRHLAFEDLGSLAGVLSERGIAHEYRDAGVDDLATLDPLAPDLLVVLGGPIGANDETDYPFLRDELDLLRARLAADLPTLGICLGAQLMARALGARVFPGPAKEIGWAPLTLTEAGQQSSLSHLGEEHTSMLHWHGDTFELPEGARLLASTPLCAHQAFTWGRHALAFQCHPEGSQPALERWLIGHAGEISAAGLSVTQLRTDNLRFAPVLQQQARQAFSAWLDSVGLRTHRAA
ncbi:MAG: glutamine amidotransferase [Candidatus Dactylopiibacterium carminicum]|uniref:Glutamine amidotransferase n=2 Tax=Candidatus Dactylopiibacterium carminicum TaxID=857335 RepID=A0A272EXB8_9RHOO|nr:glutamine amidotransferase [Candidatus Dactylopiibacterium carminicum]PAS94686.1 MAG: glutamine amidotransferase [Candidatus Dactylopiibacterium carminicum]PAS97002.1 MAG: glutamine amidotransferase [Candidatus Dactylopiibacterium carminicum]PAT00261.1 MAG: glutamine amidotransferase [Candidatus Dactylopiibacterium carminicum]